MSVSVCLCVCVCLCVSVCVRVYVYVYMYVYVYVYEDFNSANQKNRKLGVYSPKLEEATPNFIVFLMDIRSN